MGGGGHAGVGELKEEDEEPGKDKEIAGGV